MLKEIHCTKLDFDGKPMFVVHTDHHDSQTAEGDTATSFRPSRSNVLPYHK